MSTWVVVPDEELYHHGIKGQKWGIRRWQNEDGTLTEEGKARYGTVENFEKAQKRKKIARNIAIGAGAAAVVGGGIYALTRKRTTTEPLPDELPLKPAGYLPGPGTKLPNNGGSPKALPPKSSVPYGIGKKDDSTLPKVFNKGPRITGAKISDAKNSPQAKRGESVVQRMFMSVSKDNYNAPYAEKAIRATAENNATNLMAYRTPKISGAKFKK